MCIFVWDIHFHPRTETSLERTLQTVIFLLEAHRFFFFLNNAHPHTPIPHFGIPVPTEKKDKKPKFCHLCFLTVESSLALGHRLAHSHNLPCPSVGTDCLLETWVLRPRRLLSAGTISVLWSTKPRTHILLNHLLSHFFIRDNGIHGCESHTSPLSPHILPQSPE